MKLFIIFIFVALLSITANAAGLLPAPAERLNSQDEDTTKNIEHFGYKHSASLRGKGAVVEKFNFFPEVVVNVLDPRFNPDLMLSSNQRSSTKNIKKFVQQIIIKTLHMFPGHNREEKKALFINALGEAIRTRGSEPASPLKSPTKAHTIEVSSTTSIEVNIKDLGFNDKKEFPPSPQMSDIAAQRLYDQIKGAIRRPSLLPATRISSIENLLHMFLDLFHDGVIEYADDVILDEPTVLNTSLEIKRRPDFKNFLQFFKLLGLDPVSPSKFKVWWFSDKHR